MRICVNTEANIKPTLRKILFISPYPFDSAPSQRFRFEQYFEVLKQEGFLVVQKPFWSASTWEVLYKKGSFVQKIIGLWMAIFRRYMLLFTIPRYDFIFI